VVMEVLDVRKFRCFGPFHFLDLFFAILFKLLDIRVRFLLQIFDATLQLLF